MSKWISLAGMLVVLVLAFGLDIAVAFIRLENARTFDTWRGLWLFDVVELAFAVSIVAFGGLFLFKGARSAVVSSIILIVGLLLFFSWPLRILVPNLAIELFLGPLSRLIEVQPFTYEFHAAALLVVMGAAGLLQSATGFRAGTQSQATASNT